ncbi:TIGR03943 family putative permease subunit [Spirochaeta cellobiosiphila]|uniref:TIGR03943 family putative permease subunit n=1 Tax=Spirochaeta cellobiosiphila TaxID=504483 RepID=UPI000403B72A|nr:TIGR03943 family protein [Spirochaeta cellobiosiphila]
MKIDIDKLIKILITGCLAIYLFFLVSTQVSHQFLHPRMDKYLVIAIVLLGILTITQLNKIFASQTSPRRYSLILFVLPLTVGFQTEPASLQSSIAQNRGVKVSQGTTVFSDSSLQTPSLDEQLASVNQYLNSNTQTQNIPAVPQQNKVSQYFDQPQVNTDGLLEITPSNYMNTMYSIFEDPEAKKGQRIKLSGFVMRADELTKEQFILSRLTITCCVADASLVGLVCEYPDADSVFPEEGWFEIEGTLTIDDVDTMPFPIIKIAQYKTIAQPAPSNQYVF